MFDIWKSLVFKKVINNNDIDEYFFFDYGCWYCIWVDYKKFFLRRVYILFFLGGVVLVDVLVCSVFFFNFIFKVGFYYIKIKVFLFFRGSWKWENVFDDCFGNEVIWSYFLWYYFCCLR